MSDIDCACANQQALWTTGESPVDKPVSKTHDAMLLDLNLNKTFVSDIQQATLDALDLVTARLDALETDIRTIIGILDSPIPPEHLRERLRLLREGLK